MPGRVFVTGASGFVGTAVLEELASRNYSINALTNRRAPEFGAGSTRSVQGSIFDPAALDRGMADCDTVIHLVGIIMEEPSKGTTFERVHHQGTRNVVDAAKRAGIKRYVHMSALGTRPGAVSNYHKTKFAAEQYVRASGLEWTIFRPSLIHGPKGEFMRMEAMWSRHRTPAPLFVIPFMPYFGSGLLGCRGAGMLQPVYVKDVARAFVDALDNRKTIGEVYPLAGLDRLTWPQLHKTISRSVVGKERIAIAIPVWKAKLLAAIGIGKIAGFNRDQVIMSQEDNTADVTKFVEDFGWTPQPFEQTLKSYAAQL